MSACDAEMCANWTGHGCICEVMDLDKPTRCAQCGGECLDDEPMDFGPFRGQPVCDVCWDATEPMDEP